MAQIHSLYLLWHSHTVTYWPQCFMTLHTFYDTHVVQGYDSLSPRDGLAVATLCHVVARCASSYKRRRTWQTLRDTMTAALD